MAGAYDPDLTPETAVAFFVRRAQELSTGKLRIKVVDDWTGNRPSFEQRIVRDVAADSAAWPG